MENQKKAKKTVNAVGMTAREEQEVQFLINTIGGFTREQAEKRLAKRYGVKVEDLKSLENEKSGQWPTARAKDIKKVLESSFDIRDFRAIATYVNSTGADPIKKQIHFQKRGGILVAILDYKFAIGKIRATSPDYKTYRSGIYVIVKKPYKFGDKQFEANEIVKKDNSLWLPDFEEVVAGWAFIIFKDNTASQEVVINMAEYHPNYQSTKNNFGKERWINGKENPEWVYDEAPGRTQNPAYMIQKTAIHTAHSVAFADILGGIVVGDEDTKIQILDKSSKFESIGNIEPLELGEGVDLDFNEPEPLSIEDEKSDFVFDNPKNEQKPEQKKVEVKKDIQNNLNFDNEI